MIDLGYYIKVSTSPSGCNSYDTEQFKCDRYLDCESCLEDKIIEHDKHIIKQYKENVKLKDTIKDIHDNVANEMYCKGIDDAKDEIVHHLNDYALQEAPIYKEDDDVANQRPVYLAIKNCINGVIEITEQLKKNSKRLNKGIKYEI